MRTGIPIHLQPRSAIPLYRQLQDQLRALVHSGELRPGDRIPASRELAQQLRVHKTTVMNAYADLEAEGIIQGYVGRGTYIKAGHEREFTPPPRPVGGPVRWDALFADERTNWDGLSRLMPKIPDGAIAFVNAQASVEFFPVEEVRSCASAVLKREGREILQLGASDGYSPLRHVLFERLRSEGIAVKEHQLLITDGCQQSLDLLAKAFLRPGDAVLVENPAYPGVLSILSASRVRCLPAAVETHGGPVARQGLDLKAAEAVLHQNRVKLILVTPDFQNPTGTTMSLEQRQRLLTLAAQHQVPIVEDHIYARLRLRGKSLPSLKALDREGIVIQIDSFSKIAFPGLRVGWCIGPEAVIERLRILKQSSDLHTDQLAQATLAEFMKRRSFDVHLKQMVKVYAKRLAVVEKSLERHFPGGTDWTQPEGGLSVWVTLPAGLDAGEMLIHARERGVVFVPGRYFYFQNPQPNTLRLGFAGLNEKEISRGIATLGHMLVEEMKKRERGAKPEVRIRGEEASRVALV
ncbi:MAG TPA: PLP-dependent aminotransferase family protein [Candidatus Acidoferrales bacterium]|nr:PLP-dependent aminotransferase family protein [Candidatus Acidoferrales bacterium]HEV2342305.1 PLP-dependent aminotransferase family protein [Candidatus Acidoferrales bacterium]